MTNFEALMDHEEENIFNHCSLVRDDKFEVKNKEIIDLQGN